MSELKQRLDKVEILGLTLKQQVSKVNDQVESACVHHSSLKSDFNESTADISSLNERISSVEQLSKSYTDKCISDAISAQNKMKIIDEKGAVTPLIAANIWLRLRKACPALKLMRLRRK